MKLLVVVASKHGATAEIGDAISETLSERFEVDRISPDTAVDVDEYDAAIIGSAVYAGHWQKDAKKFVEHHADALHRLPVWLFSSGPLGDPPGPVEEPVDVADMCEAIGPRSHTIFAGKLDLSLLGFAERAVVRALHAPDGDFRDWDTIRRWANDIGDALAPRATSNPDTKPEVTHG